MKLKFKPKLKLNANRTICYLRCVTHIYNGGTCVVLRYTSYQCASTQTRRKIAMYNFRGC